MKSHTLHQLTDHRGRKILMTRWTRRILFVLGGLAVGAAAVAMAVIADEAYAVFDGIHKSWPVIAYLLPPVGFGFITAVTIRFFPLAKGSGIPQVIAARRLKDPELRKRFVSLPAAFGKVVLLGVGLLCGASIGREGPTIQVGAAIMLAFGRFSPRRQPGLLLAGSAAGVAAAFNAPLAGIVFGIEEMSRSFEVRTSGLILGTVIAAGLTSLAIVGHYAYFGHSTAILPIGPSWIAVGVAGVVCGLAGGLFSRILALFARGVPGVFGGWIKAHPVMFAVLCGGGVSLCGLVSGGSIFGTGYEEARSIIDGEAHLSPLFGPAKLAATALSSISGIPGGLFSPSLAVGAGIGADLHWLMPDVPISTLAILCMAAYLSGVVQAPITSFVIVSEMTDNHALVLPIMLCCLIATGASKLIVKEGIYQILAELFLARIQTTEEPAKSG
ncbi:chloride channel protein [Gimibacter soli]|uniref:Chloride channel protein n=1 Tax=Gimibacter soli TaxID=3024400 RepID=A0AAE9XU73_9PROT|nr:chloride channel protein [Gimibacter soli]WCL53583.1 chloride channel protein [Gimibacter soli]